METQVRRTRVRDKLYIIAVILEIALGGKLKTQIMYRANLSFPQVNDYLKFLVKTELLTQIVENNKEIFKPTEKGIDFLQRYREITELLGYDRPIDRSYRRSYENNLPKIKAELRELKKTIADLEIDLSDIMTCPVCKEDVFRNCKFCPNCGVKLKFESAPEVTK